MKSNFLVCTILLLAGLHQTAAQVSFAPAISYAVGSKPTSVAAVDVNGDGRLDLISANYNTNSLTVLTNTGSGSFVKSGSYSVGSQPDCVIAANVNGDGWVDLICANWGGNTLSVLTNNGSGGFVLSATLIVGSFPASVTAADVNGDGKADLVCANWGGNTLTVLTNNGTGGFVRSATLNVGNAPHSVTTADVNGDGKVDLICANSSGNTLSVLTNNGSGGFTLSATVSVSNSPQSVAAADVNGDDKADLICTGSSLTIVLTNHGNSVFTTSGSYAASGALCVIAADVDGDGWVDLICANEAGGNGKTLTVLTNNGGGGFGFNTNLTVGTGPFSVAAADVNGDGRLDLVCPNLNDDTLSVLINTATFTPSGSLRVNLSPSGAVTAGVQWQVDGGAWQNSGATVYRLSGGSHTLAFSTVAGWTTPTNQTAIIFTNQITTLTGSYVQQFGTLAGNSIGINITGGTYPFASYGYYLFLPATNGNNYQVIGIFNVTNSIGTYSYSRAGAIGTINFTDSLVGSIVGNLSFSNSTFGTYFVTNAALSAYQSGNFEMFAGQVPDSITGKVITNTVQNGLYPFANTGVFTLKVASSGNAYTIIGDGVNTLDSSGSYSYSEINSTTGMIQINDSGVGVATTYFAFSTPTAGVFAIKSAAASSYQIGNFVMADAVTLPPLLQAQAAGNNFVLTWPVSAQNFNLQTTTNLANPNSWMTLTNVPAIVNLQNVVTNPVSDGARFYRLKK